MTTIASSLKCMAADSMVSDDSCAISLEKMTVVGGAAIVGFAGDLADGNRFVDYLQGNGKVKRPKFKADSFEALVLTPLGLFYYDSTCRARQVTEKFAAIGTGTQAAMAKMHEGGGPVAAVRHAIRADKNSEPPIRVLSLAALKRKGC